MASASTVAGEASWAAVKPGGVSKPKARAPPPRRSAFRRERGACVIGSSLHANAVRPARRRPHGGAMVLHGKLMFDDPLVVGKRSGPYTVKGKPSPLVSVRSIEPMCASVVHPIIR